VQKSGNSLENQASEIRPLFPCRIYVQNGGMIYGYARVSTDGQSVDAQVAALTAAGAEKVFREVASGAKTDRAQLARLLDQLDAGDVLDGDAARPPRALDPRSSQHPRGDHRALAGADRQKIGMRR
jgi:Resolvase, N terminal domain